jgi:hypothetical protein
MRSAIATSVRAGASAEIIEDWAAPYQEIVVGQTLRS